MSDLADSRLDPLDAVRSLAASAGHQRGVDLTTSGLRLFVDSPDTRETNNADEPDVISPFDLGRTYELLLAPQARRKTGAHLTPEHIARQLVAMLPAPTGADVVLDPAVGGAAFLLASADRLVAAGANPSAVMDQLVGIDIDPGAVAVAEAAIVLWGIDHGVAPRRLPRIDVGDGLLDDLPPVDVVVGNPPFLNQLRSSSTHTADRRATLRARWGDLVRAYTDDAWLFLAAGLDALGDNGSLAMVQPVSILAARDGEAVRRLVHQHAALTGLWVARDQVFDAAVQVCGVVLHRQDAPSGPVDRCVGADFAAVSSLPTQPAAHEWGSAAAATLDVPIVHLHRPDRSIATIATIATATAGFRDQFYGFVPYVSEAAGPTPTAEKPRLVTVGMIDVLGLSWGRRDSRFAKQRFVRPVVDLDALHTGDPVLSEWVQDRRRPKLLMATQTRVVEVWVDEHGHAIPATPVVSIEPHDADQDALWMLAAALSAPALSARLLAAKFGTAMALNSMKLAARDVLAAPLPTDEVAWREAATLIRSVGLADNDQNDIGERADLASFAELMGAAYEVRDPSLVAWWLGRLPNRSNTE